MSRETHADGSYTERYSDGSTVTSNSDGTVRETTRIESSNPIEIFTGPSEILGHDDVVVTRDGDNNVINIQNRS